MRVGRVGDRYVPASPCQVRVQGGVCLYVLHRGMEQAARRRLRAAEKAGALSFSLPLPPNSHSAVPGPAHLTHQSSPPAPPSLFPKVQTLNHHYQHTTNIAQRTASVSAWDSPPPQSLRPESSRVLVPSATPQPSPRYPQRPPCSCSAPYPVTPPPFRAPVAFPAPNDDDGLGL